MNNFFFFVLWIEIFCGTLHSNNSNMYMLPNYTMILKYTITIDYEIINAITMEKEKYGGNNINITIIVYTKIQF